MAERKTHTRRRRSAAEKSVATARLMTEDSVNEVESVVDAEFVGRTGRNIRTLDQEPVIEAEFEEIGRASCRERV